MAKIRGRLAAAEADIARLARPARRAADRAVSVRPGRDGTHAPPWREVEQADPRPARPSTTSCRAWTGSRCWSTCSATRSARCRSIHLTGTNGKTSTARMVEALLRAFGLRTGRFTSPHLHSITERIAPGRPAAQRRTVRRDLRRHRALPGARRRAISRSRCRSSRCSSAWRSPRSPRRRSRSRSSRSAWADRGTRPTSPTAGSRSSPRSRSTTPTSSAERRRDRHREGRASSSPARIAVLAAQPAGGGRGPARAGWPRSAPTVAREGVRVRRGDRAAVAVGGQVLTLAGARRGLRRGVPAAARRAPGAQRRLRAGGRRGVPRRRRGPALIDLDVVRAALRRRQLARAAGGRAQRPDRHPRRGAQPGRSAATVGGARRVVRVRAARRRGRRPRRQGRPRHAGGPRAGARRGRDHPRRPRRGAMDRRRPRRAGGARSSAPTGSRSSRAWTTPSTSRSSSPRSGEDQLGGAGRARHRLDLTVGEARTLLGAGRRPR